MAQHRRVRRAAIATTLLMGVAVLGTTGVAAASPARSRRAAAAAPTSERLALVATLTVKGQHVAVHVSGVAGTSKADLQITAAGTSLEVRRVGSTVYVHVPPGTASGLPTGKTWGRLSLPAVQKQLGISLPGLSSPGAGSILGPGDLLKGLAAVSTARPRKVGLARIHGIVTTAYRSDIDLGKALGSVPAAEAAALKALLGGALPAHVPTTVWVDAAGRLVQLQTAFPLTVSLLGAKLRVGVALRAQTWGFGVPVHVSPPPAASVAPLKLSALPGGLSSGLSGLGHNLGAGLSSLGSSLSGGLKNLAGASSSLSGLSGGLSAL